MLMGGIRQDIEEMQESASPGLQQNHDGKLQQAKEMLNGSFDSASGPSQPDNSGNIDFVKRV